MRRLSRQLLVAVIALATVLFAIERPARAQSGDGASAGSSAPFELAERARLEGVSVDEAAKRFLYDREAGFPRETSRGTYRPRQQRGSGVYRPASRGGMRQTLIFWALLLTAALMASCGREPSSSGPEPASTSTSEPASQSDTTTSLGSSARTLGTTTSTTLPTRFRLPAYGPDESTPRGIAKGVRLSGDLGKRCVRVVLADGNTLAAIWPNGTTAEFGPLRVFDTRGELWWSEGEMRDLGGGQSTGRLNNAIPAECRTGDTAFVVTSVNPPT